MPRSIRLFAADIEPGTTVVFDVSVNGERLLRDLATLRTFGASGNGVVRPMFSDIDLAARQWLVERFTDAGLAASIDAVGNVYGRSPNDGPAVLIGSHSDTQPEGGWLDGAMGVIHALEVARALLEKPGTAHLAVDVVSWADEEGTYASFLGSRSFVDEIDASDLARTNDAGESVTEAVVRAGLSAAPPARLDPKRHIAFLESHIEQGPRLEATGNRIGVVSAIVGIRTLQVTFTGQQNHAGTTPMPMRRDAAAAMFNFANELNQRMPAVASENAVWTIGQVSVEPGAQSIVPGRAEIMVQFRDTDSGVLDAMQAAIEQLGQELDAADGVRIETNPPDVDVAPAPMAPAIIDHVAAAAAEHAPGSWMHMPSAAGHDAMVLANHVPTGMVFIPSINGISHDFAEDSAHDDIVLGAQVLAAAAVRVLEDR